MKHIPLTLLFLAAITFYACDPTPHDDEEEDPLTAEDETPKYKDHEIDSIHVRVYESTELLDHQIRVAQDDVDSLLKGL